MAAFITKKADNILKANKFYRVSSKEGKYQNYCYCTEKEYKKYTAPNNKEVCKFDNEGESAGYKALMEKIKDFDVVAVQNPNAPQDAIWRYMWKNKIDKLIVEKGEYTQLNKAKDLKFVETLLNSKTIKIANPPYFEKYYTRTDDEI